MASKIQFVCNELGEVRYAKVGGREYLVAPVVAIKEDVLNGEFVSADEISNYYASWNGRPFVLGHPEIDGEYVSANEPHVLNAYQIGQLFNVKFEDKKLKGELWIDVDKCESRGGDAYEVIRRLENNEHFDVSTGYFRDFKPEVGTYQGKNYEGVAYNLHPDHLAALLHVPGACSWAGGCGAPRVNTAMFTPPQAAQDNARKALRWKEEHPDEIQGGTRVGWVRARQLASGKPVSLDIVKRMAQFNRHRQNSQIKPEFRGTPWKDAGYVAWLIWGGTEGIDWAIRTAKEQSMEVNIRETARTPEYDGIEEVAWADVAKTFENYLDGYYEHTGAAKPDEMYTRVQDLPQEIKTWIASKSLLGDANAEDFSNLQFFPVVNPNTDKLNAGALRAVLSGRGAAADIPQAAKESAQAIARRLLEDEFGMAEQEEQRGDVLSMLKKIWKKLRSMGMDYSMIIEVFGLSEDEAMSLPDSVVEKLNAYIAGMQAEEPEPESMEETPDMPVNCTCNTEYEQFVKDHGGMQTIKAKLDKLAANEKQQRQVLIDKIAANSAMEAKDLEGFSDAQLQMLADKLKAADYAAQGGGPNVNQDKEDAGREVVPMLGVCNQ